MKWKDEFEIMVIKDGLCALVEPLDFYEAIFISMGNYSDKQPIGEIVSNLR
jgi:hypothetical protein